VVLEALKSGSPESRLGEAELLAPQSIPQIFAGIQRALPGESLADIQILRIPDIALSAAAGTVINGSVKGTAGPRVTWAAGSHTGFLTAGHVAHGTTNIYDASNTNVLGTTKDVLYPGAATSGSKPNVDVALISSKAAGTTFLRGNPITGSASIDVYLNTGAIADTVVGMISWYVFPGVGNYIDLYMTNGRCTNPGDSGAVVTAAGSNHAIGMVIGGTTGTFTSFVQDIHRQIDALKNLAGLGALSL
jgi:hypothetical protein